MYMYTHAHAHTHIHTHTNTYQGRYLLLDAHKKGGESR
jgi:hypothetical protein